ncbi:MAG: PGF-pre-PGF domain-containing protein [Candidatus Aenigmarchaeota archaeon]|nr:PGF-pre-PGF domain-containing protein [Candidatus Aenigmarchaeota archaeon]
MPGAVEIYAIDPTTLNFTEATVTVTAKGDELWKCKDWDFEARSCKGMWNYLMNIVPGQDYSFILTPEDPAYVEMPITGCAAENNTPANTFNISCTPANGSALLADDTSIENHTWSRAGGVTYYGGVRINATNTSITNCDQIIKVEICYKWWREGSGTPNSCDISVDANNGASYTAVNTTCPGTSEPASVICQDVTANESWQCSNFFGASASGAIAKSEISRTSNPAQSGNGIWDVLRFNVTYNTKPTHTTPILNSTTGNNYTSDNLTCYNQSTSDANGDTVKNIYNFYKNATSVMVLNMPFEGGGNSTFIRDYSGYGNNATFANATFNRTGGYDGRGAYEFNRNSWIYIPDSTSLNITENITIMAWIKTRNVSHNLQYIVEKGYNDIDNYALYLALNQLAFEYNSSNTYQSVTTTTANLVANTWYHVAVTTNGTALKFYLNGNNIENFTLTNPISPKPYALMIGAQNKSTGAYPFNGTIDEVMILNSTLTPEQIKAIYQNKTNTIVSQELAAGQNWTCQVTPNDGYIDGSTLTSNWLVIKAITDNYPTALLIAPLNASIDVDGDVSFTCNASDDFQLSNITFYWNYSGSWQANGTAVVSGTNNSTTFERTNLNDGTILWNCRACDNASQCSFAPANWTVTVNKTLQNQPPKITLNLPANNTIFNNTQDINFNFTAIDDYNSLLICSIYLDNVLNATNNSVQNNTLTNFLITGISYGNHNWSINCSDGELSNVSETRFFSIADTIGPSIVFVPPTPGNNTVLSRDWTTINASVSDTVSNISTCILEWNGSNESMTKVGSGTNVICYTNKTGLTGNTNYTYKVYANDTSNNWNVSETRNVFIGTPPKVVILHPSPGEVFDENSVVVLVANITDPDGLNLTVAEVTLPNSSKQNVTLYIPPNADNFDENTVGIAWTKENYTEANQTCVADIDTTVQDKAFTSISGDGSPLTDTYCGLVSMYPVCKNFDMNVSFNITHEEGIDYAMLFSLIEKPSLPSSSKIIFMSIGNWTGYGRTYDVFINDGNISDYVSERPTNDTYGKFRIKREGNNFTFYTWNNTANEWYEEVRVDNVNISCALFINLESETAQTGWGSINVTWDNLTISAPELYEGVFSNTSASGIYNVTFFARDNYTAINDTEQTYFNITEINDAPSVPYILSPAPNLVIENIVQIQWSNVFDEENDSLQFNITLLNPNYSENATIVTNYGNASTTSYNWDTTLFQDGNYSLKLVVFENETAERLSSYSIMTGTFAIDNTPPVIEFVSPTETSGSTINRNYIQINVTASDLYFDYVEVFLYNSTGLLNQTINTTSPYFVNFTNLPDGLYYFNATAYDAAGNSNSTETRNVTIAAPDTSPPVVNLLSPTASTYSSTAVPLSWTTSKPTAWCGYSLNGGANITVSTNTTITAAEGTNTLILYCNDSVGRMGSNNVTFTVSIPAPPMPWIGTPYTPAVPPSQFVFPLITPEKPAVFQPAIPGLDTFSVYSNRAIANVSINVSAIKCPDINTTRPIYLCFDVNSNMNESDINRTEMAYCVNESWIAAHNVSSTVMVRLTAAGWQSLLTLLLKKQDNETCFVATGSGFSYFAILGLTIPQVCVPLTKQCAGKVLQVCNIEGTGWTDLETCEYGCSNISLKCNPAPECTSGQTRCIGNTIQLCVDGKWTDKKVCEWRCIDGVCSEVVVETNWSWLVVLAIVVILYVLWRQGRRWRLKMAIKRELKEKPKIRKLKVTVHR